MAARGVMAADIFVEQQALEQNGQLDGQRVLTLRYGSRGLGNRELREPGITVAGDYGIRILEYVENSNHDCG